MLPERYNRLRSCVVHVVVVRLVKRQTVPREALAGTNIPRNWSQTDRGGGGGRERERERETETETERETQRERDR